MRLILLWRKQFKFVLWFQSRGHILAQINLQCLWCFLSTQSHSDYPDSTNTFCSDSKLATCGSKHTTPDTWKKHTKKSLSKKTLQAAVFEEEETKAFATSAVFRDSPGHWLNSTFPWGTIFFLPPASIYAKDNFVGSSARTPQLRQTKPKCIFLVMRCSGPLLAAPCQGSYCRALSIQLESTGKDLPGKACGIQQ